MEISKPIGTVMTVLEFIRERLKDGKARRFKWETVSSIIGVGLREQL